MSSSKNHLDKGKVHNPGWRDYKLPTAMDTTSREVVHVITNNPEGPFGAEKIGAHLSYDLLWGNVAGGGPAYARGIIKLPTCQPHNADS